MTDLLIPDDPTAQLAWARDVLQHPNEFIGIVSGTAILRRAASIVGGRAVVQIEEYIVRHKRRDQRDSNADTDAEL